jgi:hypothetical protein
MLLWIRKSLTLDRFPVQGIVPNVHKERCFRINSELEHARWPNPCQLRKKKCKIILTGCDSLTSNTSLRLRSSLWIELRDWYRAYLWSRGFVWVDSCVVLNCPLYEVDDSVMGRFRLFKLSFALRSCWTHSMKDFYYNLSGKHSSDFLSMQYVPYSTPILLKLNVLLGQ